MYQDFQPQCYSYASDTLNVTVIQEEHDNYKRNYFSLNTTGSIVVPLAFICGICIGYYLTRK